MISWEFKSNRLRQHGYSWQIYKHANQLLRKVTVYIGFTNFERWKSAIMNVTEVLNTKITVINGLRVSECLSENSLKLIVLCGTARHIPISMRHENSPETRSTLYCCSLRNVYTFLFSILIIIQGVVRMSVDRDTKF